MIPSADEPYQDPVEWVESVADALKATAAAQLRREPTGREMMYLLGGYLLGLISVTVETKEE